MKFNLFKKKDKEERSYINSFGLSFQNLNDYNNKSAMNISAFFGALNLISNTIASLPIKVITTNENAQKNELKNHNVSQVFGKSNHFINKYNLIKSLVNDVVISGNGFCYIERAKNGEVLGIKYLQRNSVQTYYNSKKNVLYYTCSEIKNRYRIEPCDMLHLKMWTNDGVNGISLISYAARTLGISSSNEQSAIDFFANGMNVNGLLKSSTPITQKQREEIRQAWNSGYNGNGGGLVILPANLSYEQLQLSPADSQLLQSRKFNVSDIARFFNINPLLLGGESGLNYSNLEGLQSEFLVHTLQAWVALFESEFNDKLLLPSENNLQIIFETNEVLRTDKAAQASYYKTMVDAGILSRNEVRKEIGYNSFDGGDAHTIAYSDTSQNTLEENDKNNEETNTKQENKEENSNI